MSPGLVYLDSSIALRTILDAPERDRLLRWLERPDNRVISSRLLRTEVVRTLRREGRPASDARPLFERIGWVELDPAIHLIAESIEVHIKALDALHLATALTISETIVVATHDSKMKTVAAHLGLPVTDPVGA